MPVTKTAKRALRGSTKKAKVNKTLIQKLEIAIRLAKKSATLEKVTLATSLADKAAKKKIIHKNKAARIKSQLSKLIVKKAAPKPQKKAVKKTSSKK